MADREKDDGLGNDTGINLPSTTLPYDTALSTSPWDFWPTNFDWGAIYQATQAEAAALSNILAVSPIATPLFAAASGRSEISTANTPSMAISRSDDIASPSMHEDGLPAAVDTARSHGGTVQSQDMILELQRHYRDEEEVLLVKEKECQDKREYLAKVRAVIERYENSNTQRR
ncbi:hypothetical protein GGI43DRAFT_385883 [Trichoderma evansii]